MSNHIKVFSPATVANVACGFDILGFAVDEPGDELRVSLSATKEVRVTSIECEGGRIPYNAEKNTASTSVIQMLKKLGSTQGIDIQITKKMPLGSGLGSSAASAAGSVFAVNKLLGEPFTRKELVAFAMEGERVACGIGHADNVAPALLGGFVLIRSYQPLDIITIPTTLNFVCLIVKPRGELLTSDSRKILEDKVYLKNMVVQTGNLAGLIVGLTQNDLDLVGRSMVDVVIEPQRAPLIPSFEVIRGIAKSCGAVGSSISGSGPSIVSIFSENSAATNAAKLISKSCDCEHIYITKVNYSGVREIDG
ncbi:MAG: homoserine kinase [Chlamydiota bacterium]|nr:homoserine kinase [Chlamydiota bacterium]